MGGGAASGTSGTPPTECALLAVMAGAAHHLWLLTVRDQPLCSHFGSAAQGGCKVPGQGTGALEGHCLVAGGVH